MQKQRTRCSSSPARRASQAWPQQQRRSSSARSRYRRPQQPQQRQRQLGAQTT